MRLSHLAWFNAGLTCAIIPEAIHTGEWRGFLAFVALLWAPFHVLVICELKGRK